MGGELRHFPERANDATRERGAIEACRTGDIEGLGVLYELYAERVFRTCFRILGNQEGAADLTQEVFLRVFRQIERFEGRAAFSTWLYRLTVNLSLNRLRARKLSRGRGVDLERVPEPPATGPSPERSSQCREARDRLQWLLDHLSPEHRTIIVLREIEELSYREIAEALGIAMGTVMSRLHRARHELRRIHLDGNSDARSLVKRL